MAAAAGPDVGVTVGTLAEAQKLNAELRSLIAEQRSLNAGLLRATAGERVNAIHVATEQGDLAVLRLAFPAHDALEVPPIPWAQGQQVGQQPDTEGAIEQAPGGQEKHQWTLWRLAPDKQ